MNELLKIVLPVLAGLIVLFTVIRLVLGHFSRKFREEIGRKFAGKQIVRESIGANFFGRSSKGIGQIRGNGALVLTPQELYFIMFAPRKELIIPLDDVTSVSTPRSHLGKTIGSKLLKVDFRTPAGEDAAAWAVRDVEDWAATVRRYQHA
ncbi:MAG: hypothetical protein PVF33_00545 [Candidatus Latescibacterota bacterium]|jgi:hypothetical protein